MKSADCVIRCDSFSLVCECAGHRCLPDAAVTRTSQGA